jgi:hypothetical protein
MDSGICRYPFSVTPDVGTRDPCHNIRDEPILFLVVGRKPLPNCVIILFISFCWRSVCLRPAWRLPLWDLMIAVRSLQLFQIYALPRIFLSLSWTLHGMVPFRPRVEQNNELRFFAPSSIALTDQLTSAWVPARYRLLWALGGYSKDRKCLHMEYETKSTSLQNSAIRNFPGPARSFSHPQTLFLKILFHIRPTLDSLHASSKLFPPTRFSKHKCSYI